MTISEEELYRYAPIADAQMMAEYPSDDELPKHKFSKKFERKMNKLIKEQKRTPKLRKMLKMAQQVAVFVLICSTVAFSCLMSVEAIRTRVIEFVTEIFEDLTHYSFQSPAQQTGIMGELTFNYLPVDMVAVYEDIDDETQTQTIRFEDEDGYILTVSQQAIAAGNGYNVILDTEGATTSAVTINGEEGVLVAKEEWSAILWADNQYAWMVTGDISSQELTKVADGISVKK